MKATTTGSETKEKVAGKMIEIDEGALKKHVDGRAMKTNFRPAIPRIHQNVLTIAVELAM